MLPFIQLGPLKLATYGLLLCMAILLGVWMAVRRAAKFRLSPDFVFLTASVAVLVALVGAKLGDGLIPGHGFSLGTLLTGAGTFLAGFLAALGVTALIAYRSGVSLRSLGDCFAPSLALGVAVVRLGCFAASCDYGRPTSLPWGVVFTDPRAAQLTGISLGVRLHPSQLYESGLGLVILVVLLVLERKPRLPGFLIFWFASLYASGRFLLEFLRGDLERGFFGPLSISQWLSLVTLLIFFALHSYSVRPARRNEL